MHSSSTISMPSSAARVTGAVMTAPPSVAPTADQPAVPAGEGVLGGGNISPTGLTRCVDEDHSRSPSANRPAMAAMPSARSTSRRRGGLQG